MLDQEAKYTKTHEWAKKDGEVFAVGLSSHALEQLGDIVFLELPKVGDTFEAGAILGVVESVKAASDMYAPVGGEIVAINEKAPDDPDMLKRDPYGEGWLIKIAASDPAEVDALMDPATYQKYIETEG